MLYVYVQTEVDWGKNSTVWLFEFLLHWIQPVVVIGSQNKTPQSSKISLLYFRALEMCLTQVDQLP